MKFLYFFLLSALTFILLSSCRIDLNPFGPGYYTKEYDYDIRYHVSGSVYMANIEFFVNDSSNAVLKNYILPGDFSIEGNKGQAIFLSATNPYESGTLKIKIYKDEKILKQASTSESYGSVALRDTL